MTKAKRRPMPPQELLNRLLRYEPETGKLFWLHRSADLFPPGKYAERSAKAWNADNAGKEAFISNDGAGYKSGAVFNKKYRAHRIIWRMVTGDVPDQVDHSDHDRSNNKWSNLRAVNNLANARNARLRPVNTSGVCGVHKLRDDRWLAHIGVKRKLRFLGYFPTRTAAMAARKAAEVKFGFHPNHGKAK